MFILIIINKLMQTSVSQDNELHVVDQHCDMVCTSTRDWKVPDLH